MREVQDIPSFGVDADLKREEKLVEDERLNRYWGESVYRLVFTNTTRKLNGQMEFIIQEQ